MHGNANKSWKEPLSKCLFDMAKIVFTALVVGSCVILSFDAPIKREIVFKAVIGSVITFSLVYAACKTIKN